MVSIRREVAMWTVNTGWLGLSAPTIAMARTSTLADRRHSPPVYARDDYAIMPVKAKAADGGRTAVD